MVDEARIAGVLDHTLLRAGAGEVEVRRLCGEAREFGFAAVCVQGAFVELCAGLLGGCGVEVACVVGFPLGAPGKGVKAFEARVAVEAGAGELDVVARVDALLAGEDGLFVDDLAAVVKAGGGARVKAILETGLLGEEEMRRGVRLARRAGCAFVKTSSGFGVGGASVEAVRVLREEAGKGMGVKASGGIRTAAQVRDFLEAGADRIGSSSCVAIMRELAGESPRA